MGKRRRLKVVEAVVLYGLLVAGVVIGWMGQGWWDIGGQDRWAMGFLAGAATVALPINTAIDLRESSWFRPWCQKRGWLKKKSKGGETSE